MQVCIFLLECVKYTGTPVYAYIPSWYAFFMCWLQGFSRKSLMKAYGFYIKLNVFKNKVADFTRKFNIKYNGTNSEFLSISYYSFICNNFDVTSLSHKAEPLIITWMTMFSRLVYFSSFGSINTKQLRNIIIPLTLA